MLLLWLFRLSSLVHYLISPFLSLCGHFVSIFSHFVLSFYPSFCFFFVVCVNPMTPHLVHDFISCIDGFQSLCPCLSVFWSVSVPTLYNYVSFSYLSTYYFCFSLSISFSLFISGLWFLNLQKLTLAGEPFPRASQLLLAHHTVSSLKS